MDKNRPHTWRNGSRSSASKNRARSGDMAVGVRSAGSAATASFSSHRFRCSGSVSNTCAPLAVLISSSDMPSRRSSWERLSPFSTPSVRSPGRSVDV